MKTAVCGAKEIHFSTQRHRGRGDSPSFLKARQDWPICSNQNQSIFELPSATAYSIRPPEDTAPDGAWNFSAARVSTKIPRLRR
jgi:hypothetical protein